MSAIFSASNYTLKFVDASFYQVARGLVLPFTVYTSYIVLHSRPSMRILSSCSIVTFGFFVGVFLDAIPMSLVGVSYGVVSSAITALHSVMIKKALDVVKGSAMDLSWYTNLLSAGALVPFLLGMGELPEVKKLFFPPEQAVVVPDAGLGLLGTFLWGSLITVSPLFMT
jgi:GDP-fucose transporter C1